MTTFREGFQEPINPYPVRNDYQERDNQGYEVSVSELANKIVKQIGCQFLNELNEAPHQDALMIDLEEKESGIELYLDDEGDDYIEEFKKNNKSRRIISDVDLNPNDYLYKNVSGKNLRFYAISLESLKNRFKIGETSTEDYLKNRISALDSDKLEHYKNLLSECVSVLLRLGDQQKLVLNLIGVIESLRYRDEFPKSIFLRKACLDAVER